MIIQTQTNHNNNTSKKEKENENHEKMQLQNKTDNMKDETEDKEEPRFGRRYLELGAEKEMRIGIAQDVQKLKNALTEGKRTASRLNVAEFLISRPEFREIIQRVQNLPRHPYAEIRDNLLTELCRPVDLLRCKLALFGATKFDPKSDLWIRITLFQGAPLKEQFSHKNFDNWLFPSLKSGL